MKRILTQLACALSLAAILGCGGEAPAPAPPEAEAPSQVSHEIVESTVTVIDPEGRWRFEVEADRVAADNVHGPYRLEPARARYEETGRAPVTISSQTAQVDQETHQVIFEGDVQITSETWLLEADRIRYDLDSGEVVGAGRTKWTLIEDRSTAAESPLSVKGEKP